jgi:threonine/homoserine/homoserine lactone efflux protein
MTDALLKGISLGLLLAILVGPIIFTIIKLSIRYGHKVGFSFVAGVSLSDIMLVVLGNVATELLRSILKHREILAICGGVLLISLGLYSFFFKKDPKEEDGETVPEFTKGYYLKYTAQGFFMNTINPGAIFFWLLACTSLAYLPLKERLICFGTCLSIVLFFDILKVELAGRIRKFLTPQKIHLITKISALIIIGFGLAIIIGLVYNHYNPATSPVKNLSF